MCVISIETPNFGTKAMSIKELVIEGIETAGPVATAEALAMRLEEARIGSIVIEEGMEPIGIVTLDDIMQLLVTELGNLARVIEAESPPY